jgi:RimJ/RimL family protein N-acetyltransferase
MVRKGIMLIDMIFNRGLVGFNKVDAGNGITLHSVLFRNIFNFRKLLGDPEIAATFQFLPEPRGAFGKWVMSARSAHHFIQRRYHYVIFKNWRTAGYIAFSNDGADQELTLSGMAILKKFRRQHIASCAIHAAVREIDDWKIRPLRRIRALIPRDNEGARAFLAKVGFKETPESETGAVKAPSNWRDPNVPVVEMLLKTRGKQVRKGYGMPPVRAPR